MRARHWCVASIALTSATFAVGSPARAQVANVADLVKAVNEGQANAVVTIGSGTFELTAPLRPKPGMKITGAGVGKTIIRNAASWAPGNAGLDKDEGATRAGVSCDNYLFNLGSDTTNVVISELSLTGPQLHGGICGFSPNGLELFHLEFKDFLWAGVRTYVMSNARIHDNSFSNAGNKSMVTTGSSGGALYLTYTKASEIWNNRFSRSPGNDGYGIKGREARDTRIHHNTIQTDFAIEFPFENDWTVEVDHNYLGGTMSIPKFSGGSFPDGGYTFHVHHNYFKTSYSFEYHRNAMEIDHNLFDFSTQSDGGNLVSGFDVNPAKGGTKMHDNLISNPGRGLYWNEGVYNGFSFTNNHVKAQTTVTPRTEGLFDFRPTAMAATTDWSTIVIRDNVFELVGTSRPLMRNAASYAAVIENNTLTNVKDVASYANKDTGKPRGPTDRLSFRLGAEEEWTIDEWTISRTPSGSGVDGGAALGGAGGRGGAAGAQVDGGAPTAGAPAGGGGAGGAITGRGGASGSAGAQAGASGGSEAGDARGGGGCNASGSDAASGSAVLLGLAALIVRRRARRS